MQVGHDAPALQPLTRVEFGSGVKPDDSSSGNGQACGRIHRMLIPRFTIRGLLISMIVCGVVFVALADAVRGKPWAIAACLALGLAAMLACIYVLLFFVASVLARLFRRTPAVDARGNRVASFPGSEPLRISTEEPME